jgi:hypothetical protein
MIGLRNVISLSQFSATDQLNPMNITGKDACSLVGKLVHLTDCFSIQQNFYIVGGSPAATPHWAQNALIVYNVLGVNFAKSLINVRNASDVGQPGGRPVIPPLVGADAFIGSPVTLSLVSTLSSGTLTLTTYLGQIPLSLVALSPSDLPALDKQLYIG